MVPRDTWRLVTERLKHRPAKLVLSVSHLDSSQCNPGDPCGESAALLLLHNTACMHASLTGRGCQIALRLQLKPPQRIRETCNKKTNANVTAMLSGEKSVESKLTLLVLSVPI